MARCTSLSEPYDPDLSRMLVVFIATGLAFMLLPGTFVGVLNLLKISSAHTSAAADAGWVQAHGHAQVFGWIGTFILGIGYYAIPRLRISRFSHLAAWTTYTFWTLGVALRWAVGTWSWHWRILFPLAGIMELVAVLVFVLSVYGTKPRAQQEKWRTSVIMLHAAGCSMALAVVVNAVESVRLAFLADGPVIPAAFNQRYLTLISWGFVVPFLWGFSSRWLPPLLGLGKSRKSLMLPSLWVLLAGTAAALVGWLFASAILLLVATLGFAAALRLFERPEKEPKLRGVHHTTPRFIRLAYLWSAVAAALAIVASQHPLGNGYAGASRHALTVGFFAAAVFSIGPRVLPAFFNVRRLWSTRVMAAVLYLINIGCVLRVVSQIVAYEQISSHAWGFLAASAVLEMTAVTLFAVNMLMTLTTGSPLEAFLAAQAAGEAAKPV